MRKQPDIAELIINVLWISTVLGFFCAIFLVMPNRDIMGSDFVSFLTGAWVIRKGLAKNLFEPVTQFVIQQQIIKPEINPGLLPFRNLPIFAFIVIPLTLLPLFTSYKIWASLIFLTILFAEHLFLVVFRNLAKHRFVGLVVPLIYSPSLVAVFQGQVTPLILLIFILVYKAAKSEKYFLAGFLSGLLFLKIQYVMAIPFLLLIVRKRRAYLAGFLTSFLIVISLNVLISGPGFIVSYPQFLLNTETPFFGSLPKSMFTIYPFFVQAAYLLQLPNYAPLVLNGIFYLAALGLFALRVKSVSFDKAFVALVLLSVVLSVHSLVHDQIILLVPIMILVSLLDKARSRRVKLEVKTTAVFLFLYPLLPNLFFSGQAFWVSLAGLAIGLYLLKPALPIPLPPT